MPLEEMQDDFNVLISKIARLQSIEEIEFLFMNIIDKIIIVINQRKDSSIDRYFLNIVGYIKNNYMNQITLDDVCHHACLSPSYVCQILKSKSNKTFIQYLNEYRINNACELLDKDIKIKDIAAQMGFSSSKYFIKIFKELKGITPGRYKIG